MTCGAFIGLSVAASYLYVELLVKGAILVIKAAAKHPIITAIVAVVLIIIANILGNKAQSYTIIRG